MSFVVIYREDKVGIKGVTKIDRRTLKEFSSIQEFLDLYKDHPILSCDPIILNLETGEGHKTIEVSSEEVEVVEEVLDGEYPVFKRKKKKRLFDIDDKNQTL